MRYQSLSWGFFYSMRYNLLTYQNLKPSYSFTNLLAFFWNPLYNAAHCAPFFVYICTLSSQLRINDISSFFPAKQTYEGTESHTFLCLCDKVFTLMLITLYQVLFFIVSSIDRFTKRHKLVHNGGFPKSKVLYCSKKYCKIDQDLSYKVQSSKSQIFRWIKKL